MKTPMIGTGVLALALCLPMAACSTSDKTTATVVSTESSATAGSPLSVTTEVRQGIDQAKRALATQDIAVDGVHVGQEHRVNDSKAVITPRGDLVIDGKPVPATPDQHALLLDYRQQIIGIADAGMDIGAHGADLGMNAAKEAVWGALTGKSDKDIESRIKPQTDQIEAAAAKLCLRMPDLLASQQRLAASMPAFRPYATMTQKDVDDCGKKDTGGN